MRKNCYLSTLVLAVLLGNLCIAQDFSNKGKDFWVAYGYHQVMNAGNQQNMLLYFAAEQTANVTITIPGTLYTQTVVVPANSVIASSPIPKAGTQDARLTGASFSPENKGIHISSDKPVVAYAHIYNSSVSGATILYPTATLGKEYYSINYTNISNTTNANCWFYVIAADTGTTTVEITPRAAAIGHPAGVPFTVNLTQGQVYNVMGETNGTSGVDLTGSLIKSISTASGGCKRLAVFSGSGRIAITCNGTTPSSDNYMVQSVPKTAWGKKYLTSPTVDYTVISGNSLSAKAQNFYRICVSDPTTVVRINGLVTALPLINNFYYDVNATTAPLLIEADKPITVAQYLPSQGNSGCGTSGGDGDPETFYLSPVEQSISKVLWNACAQFQINPAKHYINVIIPNGGTALSSFRLDGNPAPPLSFVQHPQDPNYSYAIFNVASVIGGGGGGTGLSHIIQSDSGFNAIAYGYGPAESYGYNAGTNIKDIYQYVSIANQFATVNFPATCKNTPFNFSMTFPYQPTRIQWIFNGLFPDVDVTSPTLTSTSVVNGRTLYQYTLPGSFTIPTPGTYPIKVVATNPTPDGCGGIQEIDYDLQVFDAPVANFNYTTNGCVTSPVSFTDNSNGNGRAINNWHWNFNDGNFNNSVNNPSHTFASPGTYTVKYSIRTDMGCVSDTATKVIVMTDLPTAKFGVSNQLCIGKPIVFSDTSSVNGSGSIVRWTWDFGEGSPLIATSNVDQTHTYNTAGTYTVSLKVESNTGCQSTLFTRQVTINANPIANFNLPTVCLPTGAAQFNDQSSPNGGGAINGWSWNFGDAGTSLVQNPLHNYSGVGPFNVSLTVTSNSGCTDTKTAALTTIYAEPQAAFTAPAEVCLGTSITFNESSTAPGSNVSGWNWDFGNGVNTSTSQNPTFTYSTPGTYTVRLNVTSANGCQTVNNAAVRTITVNALPVADFNTSLPGCVGSANTFTNASIPNSGSLVKWTWNYGDGNNAVLNTGAPFNHTYNAVGSYTITLQVENSKGCVSPVKTKTIDINVKPVANFIVPEACLSDVLAPLIDSSYITSGTIASWQWNFGDPNANASNPNVSTVQNPTHHYTSAGSYTANLIAFSDKGCSDTLAKTFFVNGSVPIANFSLQNTGPLCSNKDIIIKDGSSVNIGSLVKLEIFWDYTNDPTIKLVDDNPLPGKNYTYSYPQFGSPATKTVTIKYVAYSGVACLHTYTQVITLLATPALRFDNMPGVCEDQPSFNITQAQLVNPIPGTGVFTGNGISSAGLFNPSVAGSGLHPLTYTYTGTNGCVNSISNSIEVNPKPGVNAGPDKVVLQGGSVALTPALNVGTPVTYLWSPVTGLSNPAVAGPTASPSDDITYTLTVTTDKNCSASDKVFVKVLKTPTIPNIFSPNGDNIHDRWEIPYLESYPGCTIDIYNRYGQLVFHSVGYSKPWDGKVNGKDAPLGTYYYVIDPKNGRVKMSGYVDIIR